MHNCREKKLGNKSLWLIAIVSTWVLASACGVPPYTGPSPHVDPPNAFTVCSAPEPTVGTACRLYLQRCQYGQCPEDRVYGCLSGRWARLGSLCPTPSDACPSAVPQSGESCNIRAAISCPYGSCANGVVVRCIDHQWQVAQQSCPPPTNDCPVAVPTHGSICDRTSEIQCGYGNCNGQYSQLVTCSAQTQWQWSIEEFPCITPAPCPSVFITQGDSCDPEVNNTLCTNTYCVNSRQEVAICNRENHTWQTTTIQCEQSQLPLPTDAGVDAPSSDGGTGPDI